MKIEKLEKFLKVSAEEGMYITSFVDGNNIIDYTSFRILFAPFNIDLTPYREITEEENEKYSMEQLEKIKEMEGEREQTK